MKDKRHYVYAHYRNDSGSPFYIGMGTKPDLVYPSTEYERAYSYVDRSGYWHSIVNKHGYTVEIFMEDLTFEEAEAKEIEFIALYGRENIGTGILCNLTDGGGGRKNYRTSEETKRKLREINLIPLEENIFNNSYPCPLTGCYHWGGSEVKKKAYINFEGQSYPAQKFLFEYYNNVKLEQGQLVFTSCQNRYCVNPDHFYVGTHTDYIKKGTPRTWEHHRQVLTEEIVLQARELRRTSRLSIKEISNQLKCSYNALRAALAGKSWNWLNG